MKRLILSALIVFFATSLFAQNEKFIAAMKKNLSALDTSFKEPANLLSLANNFERIATAEKKEWLPYYYAAFCQVNYGYLEKDKSKADSYADKATALIAVADSLSPNNSEISCIKSMIASCHLMVDPMQRYMEYGPESSSNIEAAIQQDTNNPRPYFLQGQGLRYTPEQFGGGCKTAKPILQISLDKYNTFRPVSDIHPNWGKTQVENTIKGCN